MRNQSSRKQEFLVKWITGLRKYTSQKKKMSLLERKKAIKLSADLAMASTRDKTTRWSQAVLENASNNKVMKNHTNSSTTAPFCRSRNIRSRKIMMRRGRTVPKAKVERVAASCIAKRLVQKRTRMLKSLLPGGEFMDDVCLAEEALDYIESLRAQVQVMRCLLTASQLTIHNHK